ncbi:hypothetical protein BD770DRAFT_386918, partial [Pilaira anomala]
MSNSIVCSGYVNNSFQFIAKDNHGFHLHKVNDTNELDHVLLSNITGYPTDTQQFDGLCSYSIEKASMYLIFSNSTVSTIHELNLNHPPGFSATSIQFHNTTTLHSFSYIPDVNNTSILAYISSSDQAQDRTLNLTKIGLNEYSSKPIDDLSLLTTSGKTIFVIQPHSIEEYRMDRMDYLITTVDTRLSENAVCNAMTVNKTEEFISIYHPIANTFDIYQHHTSSSSNYNRIEFKTSQQEFIPATNATNVTTTTPSGTTSKPSSSSTETQSRPQENGTKATSIKVNTTGITKGATTTTTATRSDSVRTTASATSTDETQKSMRL